MNNQPPESERTARGKIGRLPYALRARVNTLIRDNKPASDIIAMLAAEGVADDVTPQNVSAWKANGYRAWARQQERIERMQQKREMAGELVERVAQGGDLSMVSNAASAIAVDHILEVLDEFDPEMLKGALAENPRAFMQLVDTLTQLRKTDQSMVKLRMEYDRHKEDMRVIARQAEKLARESGSADMAEIARQMESVLGM